jgi:hypothetical protein
MKLSLSRSFCSTQSRVPTRVFLLRKDSHLRRYIEMVLNDVHDCEPPRKVLAAVVHVKMFTKDVEPSD